ncbi:MAG: hypothetical protein JXN59_01210, partial [Anaerolineae bacterium]|nr:hypothetical protein [Anaerolineae bacterium]
PDLLQEGLAREIVRRVQMMRRDADFEISDHINVTYQGSEAVQAAFTAHMDYIAAETLADDVQKGSPAKGAFSQEFDIDEHELVLGIQRTG